MIHVHMLISGKVQGVNFRYFTKQKADNLDIKGWVKNLDDGRVEIIAEGQNDQIDSFITWCKEGPPQAYVKNIEIKEQHATKDFNQFSIIR